MNGLVVALLTYNRPSKALSTALSISKVISNIPHVEFLIIENNSRCNMNINLVGSSKVSYFLKKVNKGLDNSIIQALAFAKLKGKIIWFVCDDDHLYIDNLPKILRQLSNMNSSLVYVPWEGPTGKLPYANNIISIYERMSFLPTIACNPRDISLLKLRRLVGTNYVHIALLNLLLKKNNSIHIISAVAGIQTRNISSRFPVFETFVNGYHKALSLEPYLSTRHVSKLVFSRAYSSLSYFKSQNLDPFIFKKYFSYIMLLPKVTLYDRIKFIAKLFILKCF